jgi:cytochrome c biogenesis protein
VPFIPVEQSGLTSDGVLKVPDAKPQELGFSGEFLPTAYETVAGSVSSAFPATDLPRVILVSYEGNLGLNSGTPQSIYTLDTSQLHQIDITPKLLAPGQTMVLPHGLGKVTFVGIRQWASLAITYDPGQFPALISAIAALAGLIMSFLVRRRRIFVRVAAAADDGGAVLELGGLTRSDAAGGFETEFAELTVEFKRELGLSADLEGPGQRTERDQTEKPGELAESAGSAEPTGLAEPTAPAEPSEAAESGEPEALSADGVALAQSAQSKGE